jgi:hypothetical protein
MVFQAKLQVDFSLKSRDVLRRTSEVDEHHGRASSVRGEDDLTHRIVMLVCGNCGESWLHELDCGDRTCRRCNAKRRERIKDRYVPVIRNMDHPLFLTLTVKRAYLSRSNVKRLRECFDKLRSRRAWKARGGIYQIEMGRIDENDRCNMHIHAIIDSPYMIQRKITREWEAATSGWGRIIDIRKCSDGAGAVSYMTKHMTKVVGHEDHAGLINAELRGTRLVQSFGYILNLNLSIHDKVCPFCGATSSIAIVEEKYDLKGYQYFSVY